MLIEGSKKGGGGGGTEAPDNLRSVQSAQIVDLISEGPIKGLVNGLKSVYLDGVPVQNEDGSNNFSGLNFAFLQGTQSQTGLPGFDAVEAERGVATEVRYSAPVVQTIANTSVDHVRVTISVPQLSALDTSNGNMNGSSFGFAIDVQSAGGGFVTLHTETITGKTTSTYKRGVRLQLPGSGPWDVRVRRTTADSTSSAIVNKFYWDSLTEIQSVTLRYPNSSVAGTHVGAQQFSRVPTRAFDILGLMIRVPTNYDPIAGTYSGIWDGTFKTAWTNNPAWVFYDLATHPRYGLGRYIKDHHLDKWQLYEIGRYCDERVSDGQGGTEPRFTCNLYLQTAVQARQALQDLAALFRAIMYWGDGQVGVVQDAPSDAVMLFTKANIVGSFSYETASHKRRHSAWTIYYNDLTQMGRRMPVVHIDRDLVRTMGVVMEKFSPIGCTSRGQALRLARWAAFSEAMGRMVSFRAGAEGAALRPGAVFKVADPAKAGKRLGGRISSSTTSAVTLDADVELQAGEIYQLEVMLVDETAQLGYRTEKRTVTTAAGTTRTLQVTPAFTVAPASSAVWVLQPTTIQPTWWRMVAKKEASGGKEFDIVAIEHDPDKFDAIEQGLKLAPKPTSGLSVVSPQLADFAITEVPYLGVDSTRIKALVSWTPPAAGLRFQVDWRLDSGLWVSLPQTSANSAEIEGLVAGTLDVRVTTVNSLGLTSQPREKSLALLGWGGLAPNVDDFSADVSTSGITLSWARCTASNYRETLISVGPTLLGATEVFRGAATTTTWHPPTTGSYSFWAQHVNTSGKVSAAVATAGADWMERGNLGIKINTAVFTGDTNYSECYIHGRDAAGAAVDAPGSVLINGIAVSVPNGPLFTNQGPVTAWILFDITGANFSTGPGMRPYVMARRVDGAWQYDDNNSGWVALTIDPSKHLVIGEIETGSPDYGNPGAPPGILSATMYAAASTPNLVASLADVGYLAKTAAASAQQAANAAAGDASTALGKLAVMRSNMILDAGEKPALIKQWAALSNDMAGLIDQANAYGITVERDIYVDAINALGTYLSSLSPFWSDTTTDTAINPATDEAKWAAAYSSRQVLLNRISDETAKRANALQITGMVTFRVVSAGGAASPPVTPGIYVQGSLSSGGYRSYVLTRVRRSDGAVVYSRQYDIYADAVNASALAADLNASGPDVIVVVRTHDEPQGNRFTHGLPEAMYRCGASRTVFGSPRFRYHAAYVLIGIPGCGEGNGAESYQGATDSDPLAWVDVSFQVVASCLVGVTANFTPNSLQDFNYIGDLDAQNNGRIGINSSGQVTGIGAGNLTTISNQQILVQGGQLTGIGTSGVQVDNSYAAIGQNLILNSDQTSAITCSLASAGYNPNGATFDQDTRYAKEVWGTADYALPGATTQNLFIHQDNRTSGGDGDVAVDLYPTGAWDTAHGIPVVPGQRYCMSAYLQGHRCNGAVLFQFFDQSGSVILGADSEVVSLPYSQANALSFYVRPFAMAVAPAGATHARVAVRKFNTWSGLAESYFWWAAPQFEVVAANATGPSPYMPGPAGSTRQLGFIGELDSTKGAPAGTHVAGQLAQDLVTTAANAAAAAGAAATNAGNALTTLATMRSNSYLDAGEKPALMQRWQILYEEHGGIYSLGTAYGLISLRDAYYSAYTTLGSYLGSLSPAWNDTSVDTPITPSTDDAIWAAYYTGRQALLNAVSDEAAKRANWPNIYGPGKPDNNATRNYTYRQDGDPAVSPGGVVDGEDWQQPSTGKQFKRIAGVWLPVVADGSIDTSQLAGSAATDVGKVTFSDFVYSNIA